MLSWNELSKYHKNPSYDPIKRTDEVQERYNQIRHLNQDLADILFDDNQPYIFIPNNYPYNVDAEHYIIWFNPKIIHKEIYENLLEDILEKEIPNDREYIYFKNLSKNSSIHHIIHHHVFLKKI